MISMMSPAVVESVLSLEVAKRLEQGVVEQGRILDLRDVPEPRQYGQTGLRQQRQQIGGLIDRRDRILIAPQDRGRELCTCISVAVGAHRIPVGAEKIMQPVGDIGG